MSDIHFSRISKEAIDRITFFLYIKHRQHVTIFVRKSDTKNIMTSFILYFFSNVQLKFKIADIFT